MDTPPPPADDAVTARPRFPKPPVETLIGRALKLRCPRCGQAKLFSGWFTMPERCSHCSFKFEREPGYFLGSTYLNYGATAVILLFLYPTLRFGFGYTNQQMAPWLAGLCVAFPLWFFRYARALWLAMDCQFDKSVYDE
jgi:hypothetical protein